MTTQSQIFCFVQVMRISLSLFLTVCGVLGHGVQAAEEQAQHAFSCTTILPSDAVPSASLHLCSLKQDGETSIYACQDARTSSGLYRLYFKGGRHPKAIASINSRNQIAEFVWQEKHEAPAPDCELPAPPQLRADTQFRGAGICKDEQDRSVACAVFRERAPRIKLFHVYMTFYGLDGRGPIHTQHLYTGANQDAFPAELEYQIGLSLLNTRCCQPIGLKYIKHAYQLFPGSALYRTTYRFYKNEIDNKKQERLSFK